MGEPDPNLLSINTATVRAQWRLPEIIAGCARRGIRMISPWRDQVAATGLKESVQRIKDAGLALSGYCRGGMFPAIDGKARRAALDDNKRAVDEALALGAPCLVLVVGGLPKDEQGRVASKDLIGARAMVRDGIGELLEAREFYAIIALATLGGVALDFSWINPIRALFWAAVINGVIAVPIMVVMMLLADDQKVMGEFTVTRHLKALGWLATGTMAAAVFAMLATW